MGGFPEIIHLFRENEIVTTLKMRRLNDSLRVGWGLPSSVDPTLTALRSTASPPLQVTLAPRRHFAPATVPAPYLGYLARSSRARPTRLSRDAGCPTPCPRCVFPSEVSSEWSAPSSARWRYFRLFVVWLCWARWLPCPRVYLIMLDIKLEKTGWLLMRALFRLWYHRMIPLPWYHVKQVPFCRLVFRNCVPFKF